MAFLLPLRSRCPDPAVSGPLLQDKPPVHKPTLIEKAIRREFVLQVTESNLTCNIEGCRRSFPSGVLWETHFRTQHPDGVQYLELGSSPWCYYHDVRSPSALSKIARTVRERDSSCGKDLMLLKHSGDVIADVLIDNARNLRSSERYSEMQREAIDYY